MTKPFPMKKDSWFLSAGAYHQQANRSEWTARAEPAPSADEVEPSLTEDES
jgi:hypothetical protein